MPHSLIQLLATNSPSLQLIYYWALPVDTGTTHVRARISSSVRFNAVLSEGGDKGGRKRMRANANKSRQTLTKTSKCSRLRRGENASTHKQMNTNANKRLHPRLMGFLTPSCVICLHLLGETPSNRTYQFTRMDLQVCPIFRHIGCLCKGINSSFQIGASCVFNPSWLIHLHRVRRRRLARRWGLLHRHQLVL